MDDTIGRHGCNGHAPERKSLRVTRTDGPDGQVLLHMSGEIDLASAPAFRASLSTAIEDTGGAIVLDLAQVRFMDSAGIEQLVEAREAAGGRIRLLALHPSVQRVLEMTGLLEWFPFVADGSASGTRSD